MDTELRRDALAALGEVLRARDAKPADRLRAAEAILRADSLSAVDDDAAAALDASDQELLAIARGVHHQSEGPAVPSAEAVPSHAPIATSPSLPPPVPRETARGPKEDPPNATHPPGLVLPKGTQKGPAKSELAPRVVSQIKIEDTGHAPEPWE